MFEEYIDKDLVLSAEVVRTRVMAMKLYKINCLIISMTITYVSRQFF